MRFKKLLDNTFNSPRNALWDLIDFYFDKGAKTEGILGGMEPIYTTVEDFCHSRKIKPLPLYQYIFEEREGFLTQAKISYYYRDEWNERFPNGPSSTCTDVSLLHEYKNYLTDNPAKHTDRALRLLDLYMRSIKDGV